MATRLRFFILTAAVVVIISAAVLTFGYLNQQESKVSLPTPGPDDEILLPAGSNFTLGPNQTRSFMFVDETSGQFANFIGCFKSLDAPVNVIGTVDPNPPTKGMCFIPSSPGNDPRNIVALGGMGPVINSPCSGNCLMDGGEVSFYNNNTVPIVIVVTYTFFFERESIVAVPPAGN